MRRIAVINQKGGVGKTTTTVNLGAALAQAGQTVVLLDADPQANMSVHVDIDPHRLERSMYQVLISECSLREAMLPTSTRGLFAVPSNIDLSGAELELVNMVGRETILRDKLDEIEDEAIPIVDPSAAPAAPEETPAETSSQEAGDSTPGTNGTITGAGDAGRISSEAPTASTAPDRDPRPPEAAGESGEVEKRHIDFVIIDCPPSLGLLTINALGAAQEVFIPVQTQFFALQDMSKLLEVIKLVQRRLNPSLHVSGILPCLFDTRTRLSHDVLDEIQEYFQERVFKTRIRANVRLAEAPSHGQTIFEYAPESHGALDYAALAEEVLHRDAGKTITDPENRRGRVGRRP